MKKLLTVGSLVGVLALAACGGESTEEGTETEETGTESTETESTDTETDTETEDDGA
jgi:ABC-type glycerol-3-phosphate transport system substrate-binding protein